MGAKTNIILVGPMGSGKSAVGRQLAKSLKLTFVDSDAEIEKRTGVDIPYIFDKEGEAGFRTRERDLLAELVARNGIVLATGGGAVLEADNRERLSTSGTVVYLRTTIAQQLERTRSSRNRPLLAGRDRETVLTELMQVRSPLYEALADLIVETGGRRVGAVVSEICAKLRERDAATLKK